jgi:hypothetical protein
MAGDVTPEALRSWEMSCKQYFLHRSVMPIDQVRKVAWNLQGPQIQDWYINDDDCLNDLSFMDFIMEVRSCWLPSNWVALTRQKMLSSMQDSHPFPQHPVTAQIPKSGASSSEIPSNVMFIRLPALTIEERKLLQDNEGCFKCRRPFQKHTSWNCPNDFPDAKVYKTLTANIISAAKGKNNKSKAIGALDVKVEQTIAVIMPSAVLGDGSDSGNECMAPLLYSHLKWSCLLDGPSLTTPLTVDALIDHGSPIVLIDQQLVNKLGLCVHNLEKLLPVSVAMSGKKKQEFSLSQFVKLSCTSLDHRYHSHVVRTIITPNLCSHLLLGGPFLAYNKIVIDHELRTCIAKDQNYDLLNPSPITMTTERPRPLCEDLPKLYDFKKAVVAELNHILQEYKEIVKDSCNPINGVNVIAAIQNRIVSLACQNEPKNKQSTLDDFQKA